MNKLIGWVVVAMMIGLIVAGYLYLNPRQLPQAVRGFEMPAPRSPVSNFKPPQF